MSEGNAGLAEIVRDVYIKPIRSLLAIDDEFPTLDEVLDTQLAKEALNKKGTPILQEIVKFARDREIPWLVDAHDGRDISGTQELKIAPRLRASDLMVLDYHLKGEELGGTTAINILRGLATNNHFNLVLLYTKGADGKVVDVMYEIAIGLLSKCDKYKLSELENQTINVALESWQGARESIVDELLKEFTSQLLIRAVERRGAPLKWLLNTDGCGHLKDLLAVGAKDFQAPQDLLLRWLFEKRQAELSSKLCNVDIGQLRIGADESCCWISCEKLFITLLSKRCAPKDFEEKIVEAIVASHPSPHRLLLTKMRGAIEQRGLDVELEILRDSFVQTAWLDDFLKPDPKDEASAIAGTVTRHWEAIGDALREELIAFGSNLRAKYQGISLDDVMKLSGLPKIDPKSYETLKHYNSYVSTKPFDRGHLTTGHVFSLPQVKTEMAKNSGETASPTNSTEAALQSADVEYWMCLSPACDMVPGQKSKKNGTAMEGGMDEFLPFSAVRLHGISLETAVGKATENLCVFININESIQAFSILPDADAKNSPVWGQMIAKNCGKFNAGTKVLPLSRITTLEKQVKVHDAEANVIAQLRSDYASNLLQKFGAQLTRPGLGMQFKSRG